MQTEQSYSADPISELRDPDGNYFRYLSINSKIKDIVLFRTLLSKLLFTEEKFSEEDEVMLFTVWERVVQKCAKDRNFKDKYFFLVFLTRNIFKNLSAFCASRIAIEQTRKELLSLFSHGRQIIGAHYFYGNVPKFTVSMKFGEPQKPKERNRIGVGYRDKGNAKQPAWDASPSWQEVAMDEWFQINEARITKSNLSYEQLLSDLKVGEHCFWQRKQSYRPQSGLARRMKG